MNYKIPNNNIYACDCVYTCIFSCSLTFVGHYNIISCSCVLYITALLYKMRWIVYFENQTVNSKLWLEIIQKERQDRKENILYTGLAYSSIVVDSFCLKYFRTTTAPFNIISTNDIRMLLNKTCTRMIREVVLLKLYNYYTIEQATRGKWSILGGFDFMRGVINKSFWHIVVPLKLRKV